MKQFVLIALLLLPITLLSQSQQPNYDEMFFFIGGEEWMDDYYGTFADINGKKYPTGFIAGKHNQRILVEEHEKEWYMYSTKGEIWGPYENIYQEGIKTDYLVFVEREKCGVIDIDGNVLIRPKYQEVFSINADGLFFAKKDEKYGVIDKNDRVVTSFDLDQIFNNNNNFISVSSNGKYGYVNARTGQLVVPCMYPFNNNRTIKNAIPITNDKGKCGIFDKDGTLIVPFQYDYCYTYSNSIIMMGIKNDGVVDVYNSEGKLIVKKCRKVGPVAAEQYGFFLVSFWDDSTKTDWGSDYSWYVADVNTGEIKYRITNNLISNAIEYHCCTGQLEEKYIIIYDESNGYYGVADLTTQEIVIHCTDDGILDPIWSSIERNKVCGYRRDDYKKHKLSYYDFARNATMVTYSGVEWREKYGNIAGTSCNMDVIKYSNGTACVVDSVGNTITPLCLCAEHGHHDCANIKAGKHFVLVEKMGVYDNHGNKILDGNYDWINEGNYATCICGKPNEPYEAYIYENDILEKIDNVNYVGELDLMVIQRRLHRDGENIDHAIPTTDRLNTNTYAFVIANENYISAIKVPSALNDGKVFKEYCQKTLGIPIDHIYYFEDATTGRIIACIEKIKQAAVANNGNINIIFYYAGHAFPDEETKSAYLLPVDGDSRITATGYSLNRLYKEFEKIQANYIVCFIDACFSGSTRNGNMLTEGRGVSIKINDDIPLGNVVVFTSATGSETAHEYKDKKHGIFTYYLLKKLQESKGHITLGELSDYISTNVRNTSFKVNGKIQTPTVIPSPKLQSTWQDIKL